jgi:hypothetical protein
MHTHAALRRAVRTLHGPRARVNEIYESRAKPSPNRFTLLHTVLQSPPIFLLLQLTVLLHLNRPA